MAMLNPPVSMAIGTESSRWDFTGGMLEERQEMRKLIGLLIISAFFVFPLGADAGWIGNYDLKVTWSGPQATVSINGGSSTVTYLLDYDVSLNNGPHWKLFVLSLRLLQAVPRYTACSRWTALRPSTPMPPRLLSTTLIPMKERQTKSITKGSLNLPSGKSYLTIIRLI